MSVNPPKEKPPLSSENVIQAYEAQIAELGRQMQEFMQASERIFGLAITVSVAGLTLGIAQKARAAIIALPFALAALLIYALQLFTERAARAGLKRCLEDRVNAESSRILYISESCLSTAVSQTRWSVWVSTVLYAFAYLIGSVAAMQTARNFETPLHHALRWWVFFGLLGMTLAIIGAGWEMINSDGKASAIATRLFQSTASSVRIE